VPNDPTPLDPFALWRQMLSQWETGTNEFVNKASESDAYSEGMHRLMGTSLAAKKMSDEFAARVLVALNLPSRADVEALGERLQSIEDRLIEVTRALEMVTGASVSRPTLDAPRRTRKPPPEVPAAAAPAAAAPKAAKAAKAAKKGTRR
jgi:hypothetical protein